MQLKHTTVMIISPLLCPHFYPLGEKNVHDSTAKQQVPFFSE